MLQLSRITSIFSLLLLLAMSSLSAIAQDDGLNSAPSPLRLSYVEGNVSFFRNGAKDWSEARLNTPLAAGDALYVTRDASLELQMGNRSFVRADEDTQFSLLIQTPDFIQFKITSGCVSLDLRSLPSGYMVEVDTPNGVLSIDRSGYYRVEVNGNVHFITRRGGRATLTTVDGQALSIQPSEEIVIRDDALSRPETYVAPELDNWDRWNYERSNELLDSVSERYLPSGIAGAADLDRYGRWRVVGDYGTVWVPDGVPSGWAPYSTGRWAWDPYYQWTWIDDAAWGWAPFHYGRWVYLGNYWAWAPGPAVSVGVYSPALVAFFGVGSGRIGMSTSGLGWVALSWGEPLLPWWGRPGFTGRPWWGGWHGPRIVNKTVIQHNTTVNVNHINYYNTRVSNAVLATTHERFGRGHVHDAPVRVMHNQELRHFSGALPVKPAPASLMTGEPSRVRPPESMLSRPVVSTRPARESILPWRNEERQRQGHVAAEPRIVPAPSRQNGNLPRPEFGAQSGTERARPPLLQRFEERRREDSKPAQEQRMLERTDREQSQADVPRALKLEAVIPPRKERETRFLRQFQEQDRVEPVVPRETAPMPRVLRETLPTVRPAPLQERERIMPEQRRLEPAPIQQRIAPEPPRKQERVEQRDERRERADLPGKPANRMYRGQEQGDGERRRPQRPFQGD